MLGSIQHVYITINILMCCRDGYNYLLDYMGKNPFCKIMKLILKFCFFFSVSVLDYFCWTISW